MARKQLRGDTRSVSPKQSSLPQKSTSSVASNDNSCAYFVNSASLYAKEKTRQDYNYGIKDTHKKNIYGINTETNKEKSIVELTNTPDKTGFLERFIIVGVKRHRGQLHYEKVHVSESDPAANCGSVPDKAPVFWDDVKIINSDPIDVALKNYLYYRFNGMLLSDLFNKDVSLYKAFTSRCYYLGQLPRALFEVIDEENRPTKSSKAKDNGIISDPIVKCPKKSEVGKTISEEEYKIQRRSYETQLQQIRRLINSPHPQP